MIPIIANIRKAIYCLNKRIDLLEGRNYLDTMVELSNKISALESLLDDDALNPTAAIDKFNEIVAFLDSINNTETLLELLRDVILLSYQQNYVTVSTYANLPTTGSVDTIYRVSNYNGSTNQIDTTSYSEYVWDNSDYTLLCVKSLMSEVFDISAYHATGGELAKYANLEAALDSNNGGGVPQSLQKGGMRVQFVHTDDNKYVQFRCKAQSFSTNPEDWEVYVSEIDIKKIQSSLPKNNYAQIILKHGVITAQGVVDTRNTNWIYVEDYIPLNLSAGQTPSWSIAPAYTMGVRYYDSNKEYLSSSYSSSAYYVRFTINISDIDYSIVIKRIVSGSDDVYYAAAPYRKSASVDDVSELSTSLNSKITNIENSLFPISQRSKLVGTLNAQLNWSISSDVSNPSYSVLVKVKAGDTYLVRANSSICVGAFMSSLPDAFTNNLDLSSYIVGSRTNYGPYSPEGTVPTNANYLLLSLLINGADYSPSKVVINSCDLTKTIWDNISDVYGEVKNTNTRIDNLIAPLIQFSEVKITELYINQEFYNSTAISSIAKAVFYRKFNSGSGYYLGLLFRNSSNATVIDARLIVGSEAEANSILNSGYIDLPYAKYCFEINANASLYTYTENVQLSDSILDIDNSQNILNITLSDAVDEGENKVNTAVAQSNACVSLSGEITTKQSYAITEPILLAPSDTINVYCACESDVAVISVLTNSGYICKVGGDTDSRKKVYNYTSDSVCNVVVSYDATNNPPLSVSIVRSNKHSVPQELIFTQSRHLTVGGSLSVSANANFGVSKPVKVYTGDIINLSITGTSGLTSVLSSCDANGTIIDTILAASSNSYTNYSYEVSSNGYIMVCGNTQTNPAPKFTIARRKDIYVYDGMYNNQVEKTKYIREKRYYFDKPDSAIPENYNSIFAYSGDTKANSNHIVNAVSYPNGEIIACREGGNVVKIALDGTENVLLNIPGAWDWRGMFIDSNYNVYVSPHATTGTGTALDINNRGIWRLPYNGTQFTQVHKLYNTSSDIPTEQQVNDDTIWTFCEDALGHIYAGVYAHTVRANPSIYRSDDGGLTWTLASNLLTDGYCQGYSQAMHIHCVIYNPYDNSLYCIVGEIETVFKSTDLGVTWVDLHTKVEDTKGTTLIAVPDGILIGSDGKLQGVISKLYSDNKSVRTVGRMWHAEFFGMRRSDVTGWIYAFTKIESGINNTNNYPPLAANTSEEALEYWEENAASQVLGTWQLYHDWVVQHYTHDAIHPTRAAILVSRDNGESWEIIYSFDTNTGNSVGAGIYCVGYFKNGECLCGMTAEDAGGLHFVNPVVISEGKHKFTENGIDLEGEIFIRTNTSNYIV